jgi:hypothetical protein
MTGMRLLYALTAVALFCVPAAALAQDARGASVSAAVSATNMDARTAFSYAGAFEYRFSRVVGFELEMMVVPTLKSPFERNDDVRILQDLRALGLSYPGPQYANPKGRVVIFSQNVRIGVPTTSTRLEPYFVAGGGIASVRRTADYIYPIYPLILTAGVVGTPVSLPPPPTIYTQRLTSSEVDMTLTIGGGLSVRLARQLMIDADVRMFRLLGQEEQNIGRLGVGVRYSF